MDIDMDNSHSQSSSSCDRQANADNDNADMMKVINLNPNVMLKFQKCPYLDGKFFKIVELEDNEKKVTAECQLCLPKKTLVKGNVGISTNFLKHLKTVHKNTNSIDDYNNYKLTKKQEEREQENISNKNSWASDNSNKMKIKKQVKITHSFRQKEIVSQQDFDRRVVKFIINTMSAISIINNASFVELFEGFGVEVMSRNTAIKKIDILCEETTKNLKQELKTIPYVCTTADVWSAKKRSFLGLTCHWIDSNFKRNSAALACRRFKGSHTFDKIAEVIDDIHSKFNIQEKIVATVSDNGSNFVKAFKEYGTKCDEESNNQESDSDIEIEFSELSCFVENTSDMNWILPKHVRCASHTLNLIATTDVRKCIETNVALRSKNSHAMAKCSEFWKMARRPKSAEKIENILGHTFSYPGVTRWNSLYDALSQILKDRNKLPDLYTELSEDITSRNRLKDSDLQFLTEYCTVLKPIADALDILQGDQVTFFGYLLPSICSIYTKFEELENEEIQSCGLILAACKLAVQKRFENYLNTSSAMAKDAIIAAFTLPKFKLRWSHNFKKLLQSISNFNDDINEVIPKIVLEKAHDFEDNLTVEPVDDERKLLEDKEEEFFSLSGKEDKFSNNSTFRRKTELEILQYITDPSKDLESLHKYPTIRKMFFRYNTCLPSSAPVERLFSFAEIINAPRRHALSDKNFENLVLLKANSKRL